MSPRRARAWSEGSVFEQAPCRQLPKGGPNTRSRSVSSKQTHHFKPDICVCGRNGDIRFPSMKLKGGGDSEGHLPSLFSSHCREAKATTPCSSQPLPGEKTGTVRVAPAPPCGHRRRPRHTEPGRQRGGAHASLTTHACGSYHPCPSRN